MVAGAVRCWGANEFGALGDGTTGRELTAVNVSGLTTGVASIAAGARHSCSLDSAGVVECWGWNFSSQLGNGRPSNNRIQPVAVTALGSAAVNRVAAGDGSTCAVTTAGATKCWGWNESGQLGDGSNENRLIAVDAVGLTTGSTAIASGGAHTCALGSGGAARCWGSNSNGQLGNGSVVGQFAPTGVTGLSAGVQAIATGAKHSCAVTASGAAQCGGRTLWVSSATVPSLID